MQISSLLKNAGMYKHTHTQTHAHAHTHTHTHTHLALCNSINMTAKVLGETAVGIYDH